MFEPTGGQVALEIDLIDTLLSDPGVEQNTILSDGALVLEALLAEFALYQNFPNPFNPEKQIAYDQAEDGNVLLQIYSVTGQLVHTLVQDSQPAGRYHITWRAGFTSRE